VTLLGVAGTAATVATLAFAGAISGLVVAAGALLAGWNQQHQSRAQRCVIGFRSDRWDLSGAAVCLLGVAVIMYSPRAA
jgi:small multidrug resistance family-3 protein